MIRCWRGEGGSKKTCPVFFFSDGVRACASVSWSRLKNQGKVWRRCKTARDLRVCRWRCGSWLTVDVQFHRAHRVVVDACFWPSSGW